MPQLLKLALWIILYLSVSFGLGQITQGEIQGWYQELTKPSFNPPSYVFPIIWSILYVMIATAGWDLWRIKAPKNLKILFIIYTLLNWAWTPIFFGYHQIMLGFLWLILINAVNIIFIIKAWNLARISSYLMMPLLAWTLFACVLNGSIWVLNM